VGWWVFVLIAWTPGARQSRHRIAFSFRPGLPVICTLLILLAATGIARANAEDALAEMRFEVGGNQALIIATSAPTAGKPWGSHAPTGG
jgi:hypothetical protein